MSLIGYYTKLVGLVSLAFSWLDTAKYKYRSDRPDAHEYTTQYYSSGLMRPYSLRNKRQGTMLSPIFLEEDMGS